MKKILHNLHILMIAVLGVLVWKFGQGFLEDHAAYIGPEFFIRLATKLVGISLAAFLTFYCDTWVAPHISSYCDRKKGVSYPSHDKKGVRYETMFSRDWHERPHDIRVRHSIFFYTITFIGLAIVLAL